MFPLGGSLRQLAPLLLSSLVYFSFCPLPLEADLLVVNHRWPVPLSLPAGLTTVERKKSSQSVAAPKTFLQKQLELFIFGLWGWNNTFQSLNRFSVMLLTSHIKPFSMSLFITTETSPLGRLHVINYWEKNGTDIQKNYV